MKIDTQNDQTTDDSGHGDPPPKGTPPTPEKQPNDPAA